MAKTDNQNNVKQAMTEVASPVLDGYDLVAYHNLQSGQDGVRGSDQHTAHYKGYEFWFTSAENKALFEQNPEKYLPAYGGFCVWGVANERKPEWPWSRTHMGPPCGPSDGWHVDNGKLYCAFNKRFINMFFENAAINIPRADKRWSEWFEDLTAGPLNNRCYPWTKQECRDGGRIQNRAN